MAFIVTDPVTSNVVRIDLSEFAPEDVDSVEVAGVTGWPAAPNKFALLRLVNAALTWVDPRTLDDLKAAKWEQAKAARNAAEYGGFTWDGSTFDSDPVATGRITGAAVLALMATLASQPYSIVWTLFDNTTRTLDASQMMAVGAALGTHVQAAHDAADARRVLINATTSAAELDAMTW